MPLMMNGFGPYNWFAWLWPLAIIDLVLKGFALWRSAKNNHLFWFIALLVFNTVGILPLIYLIAVDKNHVFKQLKS